MLCLQSKSAWMTVSFVREFVHAKNSLSMSMCPYLNILRVYIRSSLRLPGIEVFVVVGRKKS